MTTDEADDYIEIEEETDGIPKYAKAYGMQLVDSRMSAEEKVFLFWLRFRAGNSASTVVRFSILAEDFGVSESTIRRWAKSLEALGHLKCSSQGFGRSKRKKLVSPFKIYGTKLYDIYDLMLKKRTPQDIDSMRSLDNANNSIPLTYERNDLTTTPSSIAPPAAAVVSPTDERSYRLPVSDHNKIPLNETLLEPDTRIAAASQQQISGISDPSEDRDIPGSDHASISKYQSTDDSGDRDKLLRGLVSRVPADTDATAARVAAKREEARRHRERLLVDDAGKSASKEREKEKVAVNSRFVEKLFSGLRRDRFPQAPPEKWDGKDRKQAKELLETYQESGVSLVVAHLFDNWEEIAKKWKWSNPGPVPTIDWLYAQRKKLFAEILMGGTKKNEIDWSKD